MIARGAEVVFSTPAQQHEFNCPFQLGWREFYPESDAPEDAETFAVDCRPGDALIMGSDGLWDNVPPEEAAEVCAALIEEGKDAQDAAEAIATRAFEHSSGPMRDDSPFTAEAREERLRREWWERRRVNCWWGEDGRHSRRGGVPGGEGKVPAAAADPDRDDDEDEAGAKDDDETRAVSPPRPASSPRSVATPRRHRVSAREVVS